jgi:hypothetical protein
MDRMLGHLPILIRSNVHGVFRQNPDGHKVRLVHVSSKPEYLPVEYGIEPTYAGDYARWWSHVNLRLDALQVIGRCGVSDVKLEHPWS